MEKKRCEFCKTSRPAVFCESDEAQLCLSCDAKVHSANALSGRHSRTLICESCTSNKALYRCFDHQMFMCQSCDIIHHLSLNHHNKMGIVFYSGCPSAKDLARIWGFEITNFDYYSGVESDDSNQKSYSSVLHQQILDLNRQQLCEAIDDSNQKRASGSCFMDGDTQKKQRMLEKQPLEHSGRVPDPQMENLNTSKGDSMNVDNSFWQNNSEVWLQNMQDFVSSDVNIPDAPTFRNFEEHFANERAEDQQQHPSFFETFKHADVNQPMPTHPHTTSECSGSRCNDHGPGFP